MPLRGVLLLLLGCASCFSDKGLAVEVDVGTTHATSVELYIGKDKCDPSTQNTRPKIDCQSIAPPDGTVALPGSVWFRDDLLPYSAAVTGAIAKLHIKSDISQSIPMLVAVGFVADTQAPDGRRAVGFAEMHDVTVPINTAKIIEVTLEAADPVTPRVKPPLGVTTNRVLVWTKHTPPSSCLVVEQWENGHVSRDFVVPEEDPDCDDVALECNPAAFHGASNGGDPTKSDCFGKITPGSGTRCVVGSFACTDDGGPKGQCVGRQQNQVCVPSGFCNCTSITDIGCLTGLLEGATTTPRIECTIPTIPAAGTGADLCTGQDASMITIPAFMNASTCTMENPEITSLPMLAMFGMTADFMGAEFEVGTASPACSFTLTWKQGTHTVAAPNTDHGAIRLTSTNGTHLIVPLVLHYVDMCTAATELSCQVLGATDDSLWSCVN